MTPNAADQDCVIREAQLEDAVAVAALITQLGYETTPEEMSTRLNRLLSDPHTGH